MVKRSVPEEPLNPERLEKHATRVLMDLARFSEDDVELLFMLHSGLTIEETVKATGFTTVMVIRRTRHLWRKIFPGSPVRSPAYMKVLARSFEMLDEAEAITKRSA